MGTLITTRGLSDECREIGGTPRLASEGVGESANHQVIE
jgi:hypothetical protein